MKRLSIITLAIVCLGVHQENYAEIRNGYDEELKKSEKYIKNLTEIAKEVLSTAQREKLNTCLEVTYTNQEKLLEKHAKTQELIEMLRFIAPDLYEEINTIKDREGNETDVYIKVVDDLGTNLVGATNLRQSSDSPNVHRSKYGDHTVSVRLIYQYPRRSLKVLFHEIGHVRYQVPHLAAYCEFYKKVYQNQYYEGTQTGHHSKDPSHRSVKATIEIFKQSWKEYNKEMKWVAKDKSQEILASYKED